MKVIEINDENKSSILELLGKDIDLEGYIYEKKTGVRLRCKYSKKLIHNLSFSIIPGSLEFINNDSYCFTEHLAKHKLY